jgi:molecular chaperone GrpE
MEENLEKEMVEKDIYLRLLADFDNFRKRSFLEKEEIKKSTIISTMEVVFSMIDEIKLAQFYNSGLDLILNKLKSSLEKEGFVEMDMSIYQEDVMEVISFGPGEKNIPVSIIKTGYYYQGEVCRYGQVILGIG